MTVSREGVNSNIRLSFGEDVANYSVSRLNPNAEAASLLSLAEAVATLQGKTRYDTFRQAGKGVAWALPRASSPSAYFYCS